MVSPSGCVRHPGGVATIPSPTAQPPEEGPPCRAPSFSRQHQALGEACLAGGGRCGKHSSRAA